MNVLESARPSPGNDIRQMDSAELKRNGALLVAAGLLAALAAYQGVFELLLPGTAAYAPSAVMLVFSLPALIELLARRAER